MGGASKCFVPGCKTGYNSDIRKRKAEGKKTPCLFRAPRDEDKLKKWRNAVPRLDRELSMKDKICELHFLPNEISKSFVFRQSDGTERVVERKVAILDRDAVPSLFPNLLSYFKEKRKYKKSRSLLPAEANILSQAEEIMNVDKTEPKGILTMNETELNEIVTMNETELNEIVTMNETELNEIVTMNETEPKEIVTMNETEPKENLTMYEIHPIDLVMLTMNETEPEGMLTMNEVEPEGVLTMNETGHEEMLVMNETVTKISFSDLLTNIAYVLKPYKWWAISSHEDFVICVKWDTQFVPERQVIIDNNLCIKVMFYGTEVAVVSDKVVQSIEHLSAILKKIDGYLVCTGFKHGCKNCTIFMERQWTSPGRPKKWCTGCKNNNAIRYPKTKKLNLSSHFKKFYQRIAHANERNARLQKRMVALKERVKRLSY